MLIELRASDDRLRGPKAVDATPIITSAIRAATNSPAELAHLRVMCDYIQYRQNFRDPVMFRRVQPWAIDAGAPESDESWEIAIDLRRAKPDRVETTISSSLQQPEPGTSEACGRVALEA